MMNRKNYTSPEVIIKSFSNDEVLTASTTVTSDDADIELPFIPAD